MLIVKHDLLSCLKTPINEIAFGKNKTWRGLLVVSTLNALFYVSLSQWLGKTPLLTQAFIGATLGATYIIFELPNSFLKRRLNIAPGSHSETHRALHMVLDRCDSTLGVSLVYVCLMNLTFTQWFIFFFIGFLLHTSLSFLSYNIGLTKQL